MKNNTKFLLDLAQVLERHRMAICVKKIGDDYAEIAFQHRGRTVINTTRNHVTQYDLRGQAGMSSKDANEMFYILKRVEENDSTSGNET